MFISSLYLLVWLGCEWLGCKHICMGVYMQSFVSDNLNLFIFCFNLLIYLSTHFEFACYKIKLPKLLFIFYSQHNVVCYTLYLYIKLIPNNKKHDLMKGLYIARILYWGKFSFSYVYNIKSYDNSIRCNPF